MPVQQDLESLAPVAADRQARRFLMHPLIPQADKERLLGQAARSELVRGVLGPLLAARATDLLPDVARLFTAMHLRSAGQVRVDLDVATALTPEQEARLCTALARRLGREPLLTVRVDPGLIAGVRARVDGQVLDNSLKTNLQLAAHQVLAG